MPNEKRLMDIARKPVCGPRRPNQEIIQENVKFMITIMANESQNPSPNTGPKRPVAKVKGWKQAD